MAAITPPVRGAIRRIAPTVLPTTQIAAT